MHTNKKQDDEKHSKTELPYDLNISHSIPQTIDPTIENKELHVTNILSKFQPDSMVNRFLIVFLWCLPGE